MNTRCPIATISYNTESFLLNKLEELYRNETISAYFCIFHHAEEHQSKDHWHVWMMPNKTINTMRLQKMFEEIVPGGDPDKPLKCIDFCSSKIEHAILYFAHYKPYLLFIHQKRRFHYDWNMFHVSDEDWFRYQLENALHFSDFAEKSRLLSAITDNRTTLSELITTGVVPLQMSSQVLAYSNLLENDRVVRGKRHKKKETEYGDDGVMVTKDGLVGGGGVKLDYSSTEDSE